eukprot:7312875-Prymnesium_polylepis.2
MDSNGKTPLDYVHGAKIEAESHGDTDKVVELAKMADWLKGDNSAQPFITLGKYKQQNAKEAKDAFSSSSA